MALSIPDKNKMNALLILIVNPNIKNIKNSQKKGNIN